jgi:hypothetical protein
MEEKKLTELFLNEIMYLLFFTDEDFIDKKITLNEIIIGLTVICLSFVFLHYLDDTIIKSLEIFENYYNKLEIEKMFRKNDLITSNKTNKNIISILTKNSGLIFSNKKVRFSDDIVIIN